MGLPASYSYSAFGLHIQSCLPLKEFAPSPTTQCDVLITCTTGNGPEWLPRNLEQSDFFEIAGREARFWFKDVATFVLQDGTHVNISPYPGVDKDLLRLYVEGMIMAMILHQRGMCVLHASVIEMGGAAIACLGHVGAGKSSTAAALYARGHRILSDDNAAIQLGAEQPTVMPGYPYVKLFPAIAASLGFEGEDLAVLHETQAKLAGKVAGGFSSSPLPLRTIYILGRNHAPEITRLTPLDATIELIRNAVPTRWGQPGSAQQFRQCADLATRVPVFAVRTFRDISEISSVVDQLEFHQDVNWAPEKSFAEAARS